MKYNNTIILIIGLFLILLINNEILAQKKPCSTPAPSLSEREYVQNLINRNKALGKESVQNLVTIPVAFHIIRYNDGSGDISDQVISNQLSVINSSFSGTNFQFSFFSIDRTDNTVWTTQTIYYPTAGANEDDMKNQLAVDPAYVLNIYYCIDPMYEVYELLGWSSYPSYYPEYSYMHGVILRSSVVPGGSEPDYNEGKTAVHEIGHYLGLFHTFDYDCTTGDDVDDTPFEYSPTEGCPDFKDTCQDDEEEDPYHNYMDYSSDNCRNNFTPGQITRMHSVVSELRPILYSGGTTKSITLDQKLSTGAQTLKLKRWLGSNWSSDINPGTPVSLTRQARILGAQTVSSNQKYYRWERNSQNTEPNIVNHHSFTIKPTDGNFTSRFNPPAAGITISNLLDGHAVAGGQIEFLDPWYIDYPDIFYGNKLRNRGTEAVFISRPSPLVPDFNNYFEYGRKYNGVFLNENQTFDPLKPIYSVRAPLFQDNVYLSHTGRTHKFYFQNWSTSGASTGQIGSNPDGYDQKAVVFTSSSGTVSANYKVTQLSNNASAFTNNSQRKLVRTYDTWLHQVYESMGRVWLEHSTDNGTTWFLGNNGQPLDNGEGKCSSIDWYYNSGYPNPDYHSIVVVYQQKYGSTSYTIEYATFKNIDGSYVRQTPSQSTAGPLYTEPAGGDQYSSTNANPTISWGRSYSFALTFERKSTVGSMQPGIYVIYGTIYETGIEPIGALPSPPFRITETSGSSVNASVSLNKSVDDPAIFNVVYQTASTSPANIVNVGLWSYPNGSTWQVNQSYSQVISYATGYLNTKPSIVQMPDNNVRVCWIRNWYGSSTLSTLVNAVYWNSASPSVYNYSGVYVNSVSLNIRDGSTSTYYAYAQNTNNTTWQNFAGSGSTTITLNTIGRHIQLSNGSSSANMYASAYYPVSLPYYFQTSNSLGILPKSSSEENTYGRGVALGIDDLGFSYSMKSLTVDKSNIKFLEIPESKDTATQIRRVEYLTLDSLNTMLISEPFTIQEGTTISFSEAGGFFAIANSTDSSATNYYVDCTIELMDENTNKQVGVVKETQFTPVDKNASDLTVSNLKISDSDAKTVRLKITLTTNITGVQGMFVNEYNTVNEETLSKLVAKEITLQEKGTVTTYELAQNYPNPFNPSTTINYQIPEDGMVTLKIYDILGKEVKTLVNEQKATGRYEVKFDASDLATGVYIYRLNVNDFVSVKKMLLLR